MTSLIGLLALRRALLAELVDRRPSERSEVLRQLALVSREIRDWNRVLA